MQNRFKMNWISILKSFIIDSFLSEPLFRQKVLSGDILNIKAIRERVEKETRFPIYSQTNAIICRMIMSAFNNSGVIGHFLSNLKHDSHSPAWPNLFNEILWRRMFEHEDGGHPNSVLFHKIYKHEEIIPIYAQSFEYVQALVKEMFPEELDWDVAYQSPVYLEVNLRDLEQKSINIEYFEFNSKYEDIENFYNSVPDIDFDYYNTKTTFLLLASVNTSITYDCLSRYIEALTFLYPYKSYEDFKLLNQNYDA